MPQAQEVLSRFAESALRQIMSAFDAVMRPQAAFSRSAAAMRRPPRSQWQTETKSRAGPWISEPNGPLKPQPARPGPVERVAIRPAPPRPVAGLCEAGQHFNKPPPEMHPSEYNSIDHPFPSLQRPNSPCPSSLASCSSS